MAIKSFIDTYKIKGSDVDWFCRIMSDTKNIKIKITNEHHDLKDIEEYIKLFGFVKNDSGHLQIIALDYLIFMIGYQTHLSI